MRKIAEHMALLIAEEVGYDKDGLNFQRIRYGLEILLSVSITMMVLMAVAVLSSLKGSLMMVALSSGLLRLVSGGAHAKRFYRCLLIGTALCLVGGYGAVVGVVPEEWLPMGIVSAGFIGLIVVYKYVPVATKAKPITEPQRRRRFQILSACFLVLWVGISLFLLPKERVLVTASFFGVTWQLFTLTPAGISVYEILG